MPLKGFESTFPASERPHTLALDRATIESRLASKRLMIKIIFYNILKIFEIIILNVNQ